MTSSPCIACHETLPQTAFSSSQIRKYSINERRCIECAKKVNLSCNNIGIVRGNKKETKQSKKPILSLGETEQKSIDVLPKELDPFVLLLDSQRCSDVLNQVRSPQTDREVDFLNFYHQIKKETNPLSIPWCLREWNTQLILPFNVFSHIILFRLLDYLTQDSFHSLTFSIVALKGLLLQFRNHQQEILHETIISRDEFRRYAIYWDEEDEEEGKILFWFTLNRDHLKQSFPTNEILQHGTKNLENLQVVFGFQTNYNYGVRDEFRLLVENERKVQSCHYVESKIQREYPPV